MDEARPQLMGHVFVNPVDENAYMAMLWYVNQDVHDMYAYEYTVNRKMYVVKIFRSQS